jgi:hypothetical protein
MPLSLQCNKRMTWPRQIAFSCLVGPSIAEKFALQQITTRACGHEETSAEAGLTIKAASPLSLL